MSCDYYIAYLETCGTPSQETTFATYWGEPMTRSLCARHQKAVLKRHRETQDAYQAAKALRAKGGDA